MAVKKAKEASFKKMDSAFATSQSAIQKVKNTDPLNGNEEQEQGNENVSIDPAHYLSKKEKKEWKRLSYTAKQRYIRQAERQLKRQKKRNGIARTEQSSVQEKEKQAAKIFSKERKYRSNTWKEPVDKKEIGSHGGNGEIASKSRDSRAAIRSQSTVAGGEKAVDIASSSTSAETAKAAGNAATKTVDTAAASTGAGLAALVAKKTAENFKEMLQQKNTAIESQRIKTQTKLSRLIEENKTAGSPGVAAAAMLASVVVTVMYFAAQIAEKQAAKEAAAAEIASITANIDALKADLKTKKAELKSIDKDIVRIEAKKIKAETKAAESAKKAEAEDVLKKLLASGVSADDILAKLK